MSLNAFGMYVVDLSIPAPAGFTSGSGTAADLHGSGPPAAGLGDPGNTYVDDDNNGLYWKSATGWNP